MPQLDPSQQAAINAIIGLALSGIALLLTRLIRHLQKQMQEGGNGKPVQAYVDERSSLTVKEVVDLKLLLQERSAESAGRDLQLTVAARQDAEAKSQIVSLTLQNANLIEERLRQEQAITELKETNTLLDDTVRMLKAQLADKNIEPQKPRRKSDTKRLID